VLWVCLAAIVLAVLLPELRRVIQSRDFSIEIAGMKLSAQRASEQLAKQIEDLQSQVADIQVDLSSFESRQSFDESGKRDEGIEIIEASRLPTRSDVRGHTWMPNAALLWVDDDPEGNAFEIDFLRQRGWTIELKTSTASGLAALSRNGFNVVISDLQRREDGHVRPLAGHEFLKEARNAGFFGRFIIYTKEERIDTDVFTLHDAGADVVTSSPIMVRTELERFLAGSFERAVDRLLQHYAFNAEVQGVDIRADFFGRLKDQRLAVEAVWFSSETPVVRIRASAATLLLAANDPAMPVDHLIIVAPHPVQPDEIKTRGQTIRIMSFEEFERFLDEHSRRSD
jgi:hypothetical protein